LAVLVLGWSPVRAEGDPLFDEVDAATAVSGPPDPLEKLNRVTFALNLRLDRWVFDPVTRAYKFVVPGPARRAVRRALANLNSPSVFVNDVLQLEPLDAAVTAGRFVINTTAGVAGLVDVAERIGLAGHHSDFGQTLALCGVPSGPYLMLPAVGPTFARDGVGYLVDVFFRPTTYLFTPAGEFVLSAFFTPGPQLVFTSVHESTAGIAAKDAHAEELEALEASAMDYYAALRSAFWQNRNATIWARRQDRGPLAVARRALRPFAPAAASGEVGDAGAHGGDQRLETLALQD
jgi:phospholipid-binding lipoprotein MlaA